MPRKQPFPPEAPTEPDLRVPRSQRTSGVAPKNKRSQGPTSAKTKKPTADEVRPSRPVTRERPKKSDSSGATVDEVVADLRNDPRREKDE